MQIRYLGEVGKGVAMSHLPETWPASWPDYPDWTYSGDPIIIDGVDKTPAVDWNGFFGRGQLNADQESYFWMDDNNDEENYCKVNDFYLMLTIYQEEDMHCRYLLEAFNGLIF